MSARPGLSPRTGNWSRAELAAWQAERDQYEREIIANETRWMMYNATVGAFADGIFTAGACVCDALVSLFG